MPAKAQTSPWASANSRSLIATPTGATAEFLSNPLHYMRFHTLSPPDDSNWSTQDEFGTVVGTAAEPRDRFKAGLSQAGTGNVDVHRRTGAGGIRHVQIVNHPALPGARTFKVAPFNFKQDGTWAPIYFLPWKSLNLLDYQIPAVPHSLAEWDDEEYPHIFFTAGLSGCSIFANGSPQSPKITHAGITGSLAGPAREFWREMMEKTGSGHSSAAIRGEIHTNDYMWQNPDHLSRLYREFFAHDLARDVELQIESPSGCVFGIRYGRSWTLYLQKSTTFKKVRFYKADTVVKKGYFYYANGNERVETIESTSQKKFGPFSGKPVTTTVFWNPVQTFSLPLQVDEIFPNRRTIGDLKDMFKVSLK